MKSEYSALAMTLLGAVACVSALFCCGSPSTVRVPGPVEHKGTSTISVVISFKGSAPANRKWDSVPISLCPDERREEKRIAIGPTGGVKDVLVKVLGAHVGKDIPVEPVVIEYRGCTHTPRVVGVRPGQSVLFRNLDDLIHNVHAMGHGETYFNQALLKGAEKVEPFGMDAGEIVRVGCDLHPWETAHVAVINDMHFGVTDIDGRVTLPGLTEGIHELEAWHPELTSARAKAQVYSGEEADVRIVFETRDLRSGGSGVGP